MRWFEPPDHSAQQNLTFVFTTFSKDLILEKVSDDMKVRTTISQSSAQRQKRGHVVVSQKRDSTEPEAPLCLNNNGPFSQTEQNGLVCANGTTAEPDRFFDQMGALEVNTGVQEEGGTSTEMFSEVSKFESEFRFHSLCSSHVVYLQAYLFHIFCPCSSFQPGPELPA